MGAFNREDSVSYLTTDDDLLTYRPLLSLVSSPDRSIRINNGGKWKLKPDSVDLFWSLSKEMFHRPSSIVARPIISRLPDEM